MTEKHLQQVIDCVTKLSSCYPSLTSCGYRLAVHNVKPDSDTTLMRESVIKSYENFYQNYEQSEDELVGMFKEGVSRELVEAGLSNLRKVAAAGKFHFVNLPLQIELSEQNLAQVGKEEAPEQQAPSQH